MCRYNSKAHAVRSSFFRISKIQFKHSDKQNIVTYKHLKSDLTLARNTQFNISV